MYFQHADAPLAALMLPFADGTLEWPSAGALFLRARDGAPLQTFRPAGLVCEQTWKPAVDGLRAGGWTMRDAAPGHAGFPLVLVLPPRQRDEARALLARAVAGVLPGGRVIAAAANDEGARSLEADLEALAGPVESRSKHKCRVFWAEARNVHREMVERWSQLDAPRPVAGGEYVSRPGLFAWDRIDPGSALLARSWPHTLQGRAADLGGGYGYLSSRLLETCAGITHLDLYEAEGRALPLARENLARHAADRELQFHWHDVTAGLPGTYDVIVTNPPFHADRSRERQDLGRRFIAVAADALVPGGSLWLVANRHLAYEALLTDRFASVRAVACASGYKVLCATGRTRRQ